MRLCCLTVTRFLLEYTFSHSLYSFYIIYTGLLSKSRAMDRNCTANSSLETIFSMTSRNMNVPLVHILIRATMARRHMSRYTTLHLPSSSSRRTNRFLNLQKNLQLLDYESDEDDDDYPSMVDEDEESDEENLPPALQLKPDPLSASKPLAMSIQSFLAQSDPHSHGLYPPVLQSHFGSPKGISFLNDSPQSGSTTRAATNLQPLLALASVQLKTSKMCMLPWFSVKWIPLASLLPPAPLAPTATRPTPFAPKSTGGTSQLSFSSLAASSAFEPISLKSMDKQRFDESLLAACFPEILQDDEEDDEGSNVVTPTAFAEV